MPPKDELINYIDRSTTATAGEYVLKSLRKFRNVLEDDRYEVRWDKYDSLIKFFSLFKHYTGKSNGNPFILEMWQKFIILNIFCIYKSGTEERKHQTSYIQVARKNGKSALSSIMALYALLADGEANDRLFCRQIQKSKPTLCSKCVNNSLVRYAKRI